MLCLIAILLVIVIIILIAMAATGKKTIFIEKDTPKSISEEPDRKCPACNRAIPFDAKLCPYCGKNFK